MSQDEGSSDDTEVQDRSDEKLTPKEAYQLTEQQGLMGKTVARMFDISQSRVSQLKGQYEEGLQEGRESVDPTDFSTEELEEAISDEEEENPYEHTCLHCNAIIPSPDSPGVHPCPECGGDLKWSEDEI